jgi:hypothetical protein
MYWVVGSPEADSNQDKRPTDAPGNLMYPKIQRDLQVAWIYTRQLLRPKV